MNANASCKGMPEALKTFIEPQIEQFSLEMSPLRCGWYATLPQGFGTGFLWTAHLGDNCLASAYSFRLASSLVLEERPTDFTCIVSGSDATFSCMCDIYGRKFDGSEGATAFSAPGETTRCPLEAGRLYESTCIVYTPDYFEELKRSYPGDFEGIDIASDLFGRADAPAQLRDILRSFTPKRAKMPGAEPYFRAKALEAVATLRSQAQKRHAADEAESGQNRSSDRLLVEQAQRIIAERFDEHLTLESVARELYVSRSRLGEAFRRECRFGMAGFLRRERMAAACRLLRAEDADVKDIARQVGYARPSAFTEAFRREIGCSPTQWRAAASR